MALFGNAAPAWPTFLNQAETGVAFNIPPNWQLAQSKGDSCIFITGDTKAVLTIIRKRAGDVVLGPASPELVNEYRHQLRLLAALNQGGLVQCDIFPNFVAGITKRAQPEGLSESNKGISYVLHMLIPALTGHYLIECFADEGKTTGLRDAICRGLVPKDQAEPWFSDPYDYPLTLTEFEKKEVKVNDQTFFTLDNEVKPTVHIPEAVPSEESKFFNLNTAYIRHPYSKTDWLKFDQNFPLSPLARAREVLEVLKASIVVDPAVRAKSFIEPELDQNQIAKLLKCRQEIRAIIDTKEDEAKIKTALDTIRRYLENIIKNSEGPQYRSIDKQFKAFRERIAVVPGAEDLLRAVGFSDSSKVETMYLEPEPNQEALLIAVCDDIHKYVQTKVIPTDVVQPKGVYELTGPKARVKLLSGYKPIQHTTTAIVSLKASFEGVFNGTNFCMQPKFPKCGRSADEAMKIARQHVEWGKLTNVNGPYISEYELGGHRGYLNQTEGLLGTAPIFSAAFYFPWGENDSFEVSCMTIKGDREGALKRLEQLIERVTPQ
jgi:hypothetical protein